MGTRSLTVINDEHGDEIVVMYRQFGGYPTGHGKDLLAKFKDHYLVNGLRENSPVQANGMGCLAAQVVASFKEEAGGFYLHPAGTRDCGEEYIYTIYSMGDINFDDFAANTKGRIGLKVESVGFSSNKVLYDGLLRDFDPKAAEKAENEEDED